MERFRANLQQNSIVFHFIGTIPCAPIFLFVTLYALICFLINKDLLALYEPEDESLFDWARMSLNTILVALSYMCMHIFPLSCVYLDSRETLQNEDMLLARQLKKQRVQKMIDKLSKYRHAETDATCHRDTGKDVQISSCVICFSDFKPGDMVCEMPCDIRHRFHEDCLESWLQRDVSCPVCRKVVDINEE